MLKTAGESKTFDIRLTALNTKSCQTLPQLYGVVYAAVNKTRVLQALQEEMTEDTATTSQLSVAMTTAGMTQITGGNTMTSSLSRGTEFYFQCAVVVIGVLGTAANALILYALVASKQHKKHVLIVHQNALDLFSSFFMIITYSVKLCNIYLAGPAGYWLCALLLSESLIWCGTFASVVNLAIITIERYLKVVHSAWSKTKLRNWMIYSAMAFAWIISFITNIALAFPTSAVIDGACYAYVIWETDTEKMIFFMWNLMFLRPYNLDLHLLLLAHSGCHSSSGARDGWPCCRRWTKHLSGPCSGPIQSDAVQRYQDHDICERILCYLVVSNVCLLLVSVHESTPLFQ